MFHCKFLTPIQTHGFNVSQVKSCDKRVQTPGMSPPRAGAWTYCLFTHGFNVTLIDASYQYHPPTMNLRLIRPGPVTLHINM